MNDDRLHQSLKEITKELHNDVEELTLPKKLFSETITKSEYLEYLKRLYKLHCMIEKELVKFSYWSEYDFEIMHYLRKDLLLKDITIASDNTIFMDDGDSSYGTITIDTFSEAIGYLYVLTGSTMGGQILSKKVTGIFPNSPYKDANNYFSAFKERTIPMWINFLTFLNNYASRVDNKIEEDKIIDGAQKCFQLFKENL